jgi:hypothetical protein
VCVLETCLVVCVCVCVLETCLVRFQDSLRMFAFAVVCVGMCAPRP